MNKNQSRNKTKKLNEAKMTISEALKIFGIKEVPDLKTLMQLWKDLSKLNHPDRGGSLEIMQDINAAMDVLKPLATGSGGSYTTTKVDWDEIHRRTREKNIANIEVMDVMFEESFDADALLDHIQPYVPTNMELLIDVVKTDLDKLTDRQLESRSDMPFSATIEVHNEENTMVVYLRYLISPEHSSSQGLGHTSVDEADVLFSVSLETDIYYNNRKNKLSQARWQWRVGRKALSDYASVLPPAKLKKIFEGEKRSSFKRADMFLGLKRELDVTIDKDTVFIYPFGKDVKFYFSFMRSTMLGQASWMFNNVQLINPQTRKYTSPSPRFKNVTSYIPETEDTLRSIVNIVRDLRKTIDKQGLDYVEDSKEIFEVLQYLVEEAFPMKPY